MTAAAAASRNHPPFYSISATGLLGASTTVFVTTVTDCVWLIPFVAQIAVNSPRIAFLHALLYVATFTTCAVTACVVAALLSDAIAASINNNKDSTTDDNDDFDLDFVLEVTGAGLCWVLAGAFWVRAYHRRRRRRDRGASSSTATSPPNDGNQSLLRPMSIDEEEVSDNNEEEGPEQEEELESRQRPYHPTSRIEIDVDVDDDEGCADDDGYTSTSTIAPATHHQPTTTAPSAQPLLVISLTCLGSLDEISYFPALIVGHVFTPAELVLGTLVATMLVLLLIDSLQRYCRGCLHVIDSVIAVFASILTVEALVDVLH